MAEFLLIIFLLFLVVIGFGWVRNYKRLKYIKNYQFHPGIKQKLIRRHPDLSKESIEQGLRDYFCVCCKARGVMVAMPSRIVDEAWHEFILHTRKYQMFCHTGLGRFLYHNPSDAIQGNKSVPESLKRTWRLSCELAGTDINSPTDLPLLFALDSELNIPNGFRYSLACPSENADYCVSDLTCSGGGSYKGDGYGGGSCGGGGGGCGGSCGG